MTRWQTITGSAHHTEAGLTLTLEAQRDDGVLIGCHITLDLDQIQRGRIDLMRITLDRMTAKLDAAGAV